MLTIQKLYNHIHWANKRILQALERSGQENLKTIQLFTHILQSEQVWLTRLQGVDSTQLPLWPNTDLTSCDQLVTLNDANFRVYLTTLTSADLERLISYRNQSGKEYQTSIRDILIHVALHGQYHRGQINSFLRTEGAEPINVDFITFVR
jgi:uncharacterized damage-inducible protein DinB